MDDATGSRTARAVAVGRAVGVAGRRDEHVAALLPAGDRFAVAAARGVGAGRRGRTLAWTAHAALRMLAVDAAVETALRTTGAADLVIVGAGYDTRAWRLPSLRGRRVVEVDHPATQADKTRRLAAHAAATVAEVVHVGVDLAVDDLGAALGAAGHDPARPTVWLWEAVVPYLPPEAVDATLAVLRERSAPGSQLVVTTVTASLFDPPVLGRVLAPVARTMMARLGEPVLLAESDAATAARLARHGFTHRRVTGPRRWALDAGLEVSGPTLDERLHVAERVWAA